MNWNQFRAFLLEQLATFRVEDSLGIQADPGREISEYQLMIHAMQDQNSVASLPNFQDQPRRFNFGGLATAYQNHFLRTLRDIPIVLGTTGYLEGASKLNRVLDRSAMYRKMPLALGIGGMFNNIQLIRMYVSDLSSGQFPGTDESIFI